MKDRQRLFLDKVVKLIVDDTEIDFENNSIHLPFSNYYLSPISSLPPSFPFFSIFHTYCKHTYGLTDQEIEYVWNEYKDIIRDKISNKES